MPAARDPTHGHDTATSRDRRPTGHVSGSGGVSLYWQAWLPISVPRAVVVLAHGGLEHGGRYAHVADRFTDAALATYAIDFRGHGRSGGRAGQIERMSLLVDDIHRLARLAADRHPDVPMFLLAHSLGAMVALEYVTSSRSCDLAGLVLSGTGIDVSAIPKFQATIAKALSAVVPNLGLVRLDSTLVSRDLAVVPGRGTGGQCRPGDAPPPVGAAATAGGAWGGGCGGQPSRCPDGVRTGMLVGQDPHHLSRLVPRDLQ